jgi:hypothetical protein
MTQALLTLSALLLLSLAASATQTPRVSIDSFGNLRVDPQAGRDVFIGANASISAMTRQLSVQQSMIQATRSSVLSLQSRVAAMTGHQTTASAQLAQARKQSEQDIAVALSTSQVGLTSLRQSPFDHVSTCVLSTSPISLPASYVSFAHFRTPTGQTFVVAVSSSSAALYKMHIATQKLSLKQNFTIGSLIAVPQAFSIADTQYVVLPSDEEMRCELFKFDTLTQSLVSVQNISTAPYSVGGITPISTGTLFFLAIISYNIQGTVNHPVLNSYIWKFSSKTNTFVSGQFIVTAGGMKANTFTMNSTLYLAIPNWYSDVSPKNTTIYAYNGTTQTFDYLYTIPVISLYVLPFEYESKQYLVLDNDNAFSVTYEYSNSQGTFLLVGNNTDVNTKESFGADLMLIDNTPFLAIGSLTHTADVLKWDSLSHKYVLFQSLSAYNPAWKTPTFARIGVDVYLFVHNAAYKWCGGQFVLT